VKIKRRPESLLLSTAGLNKQMSTNITEKKKEIEAEEESCKLFFLPLESAAERGKHDLVATVNIHTNTDDVRN
jgi:hypothetical protein